MESLDTTKDRLPNELELLHTMIVVLEQALEQARTAHMWTEEEEATAMENPLCSAIAFRGDEGQTATHSRLDDTHGNKLLLSMASHELGNALTAIKGSAQILERRLLKQQDTLLDQHVREQANAAQLSLVKAILHQTSIMQELIGQFLDVSRVQSGHLAIKSAQQANLVALVRSVVEQYQAASQRVVVLQASEDAIFASYDAFWIEQVLHNLVGNAIKYSSPDTAVVVGIERQPETSSPQEVVIWVRDEGSGISQEHHSALFRCFYRVRTRENAHVKGLGLGLYISHEVIRRHGGRMWLKSEPGRGSTFFFALPLEQTRRVVR